MSRRVMDRINSMSRADALAAFKACCGSTKYAEVAAPQRENISQNLHTLLLCVIRQKASLVILICLNEKAHFFCAWHTLCTTQVRLICLMWWLQSMAAAIPFHSAEDLISKSDNIWAACGREVSRRHACYRRRKWRQYGHV